MTAHAAALAWLLSASPVYAALAAAGDGDRRIEDGRGARWAK